jgi:hypothetical protein
MLTEDCILDNLLSKLKDIGMTRITVEIDDNKAAILADKAKKYGLLPEQFVTASIEDLISQENRARP